MAIVETVKNVPVDPDRLANKGYLAPTTMSDSVTLPYFMAVARAYSQSAADARDAAGATLSGTSATSNTISAGTKNFTASGSKGWVAGSTLVAFSAASPTNALYGRVASYNSGTGALVLDVPANSFSGTGTFTDWIIAPGGVVGPTGATGPTGPTGPQGVAGPTGATGGGTLSITRVDSAAGGEGTFTLAYFAPNLIVIKNGVTLQPNEFTATNGTSFTLNEALVAGDSLMALGFQSVALVDGGVPPARAILTQHSLTGGGDLTNSRTLNLVNDTASPGSNKVYGTNSAGTRGWQDAPTPALNLFLAGII